MKRKHISPPAVAFALPNIFGRAGSTLNDNVSRPFARFRVRVPNGNFKKIIFKILLVLAGIAVIGGAFFFMKRPVASTDTRVAIEKAKASQTINQEFAFPLKDDKGKVLTSIKYTVQSAELHDEIIVKGQRASSVKGRTFLIIALKITNEYDKSLDILSKDYIRLIVNGNETEPLAPDIHNDPVTVQPISTKYTRVGFPINDTDTNMSLRVGELNGDKQTIALDLK
jgi:hypothetical protein